MKIYGESFEQILLAPERIVALNAHLVVLFVQPHQFLGQLRRDVRAIKEDLGGVVTNLIDVMALIEKLSCIQNWRGVLIIPFDLVNQ